jgi:hypothetical protein
MILSPGAKVQPKRSTLRSPAGLLAFETAARLQVKARDLDADYPLAGEGEVGLVAITNCPIGREYAFRNRSK